MAAARRIAQVTLIIVIMNGLSRLLGFGREMVIAHAFGAGSAVDAYLVAYTLPYLLQSVLGMALVTVMVPVFTQYLVEENEDEGWRVASSVFNLTVVALVFFTFLGVAGAPLLVKLTAPGFSTEVSGLATRLTRIMFPSVIFMGMGMLITGILNACYRFAVPAFAPGFSNLIIIVLVLFGAVHYGIDGLAVGTLLGMVGLWLIQLPVLARIKPKPRYSFSFDYQHPAVKKALGNIIPIAIGLAVTQIYYAINRILASGLAEGSIAALNYAAKVMNLPLGIFVAAVSAAIFPALSAKALKNDLDGLRDTMMSGLRMVTLVTVPAAVGLMVLSQPVIKLLFERGVFDATATTMTASALVFFSVGLLAQAANLVITRAYYAFGDVRTPMVMCLFSVGINVVLSFPFLYGMGHAGLALANSLAATANMVLLYIYLRRHLPHLGTRAYLKSLTKIIAASGLMGGAVWMADYALAGIFGAVGLGLLCRVGIGVLFGVLIFTVFVFFLRLEEVKEILDMVRSRLSQKSRQI